MTSVIVICFILAITQTSRDNIVSASLFTGAALSFDQISIHVQDEYYYLLASSLAFACSLLIKQLKCSSELSVIIQEFCIASILLNFIGWSIYEAYLSPNVYNIAFLALYLFLSAVLTKKGDGDAIRAFRSIKDAWHYRGVSNASYQSLELQKYNKRYSQEIK